MLFGISFRAVRQAGPGSTEIYPIRMTYHMISHAFGSKGDVMANSFPQLIKQLRDRLGLSQEKLAARLGVSLPTINRWEKGKTKPDTLAVKTVVQFVRDLGGEYRELYEQYFGDDSGGATDPEIHSPRVRRKQ